MRNLKKFLALVLAVMMVMGLMVTANAASIDVVDGEAVTQQYEYAVDVLAAAELLKGSTDGYDPKGTITRQEYAVMLYRLATGFTDETIAIPQYGQTAADTFDDIDNPNAWYAGAVGYCVEENLLVGQTLTHYGKNESVKGYDVLVGLLRVLGYDKNGELQGAGYTRQVGIWANGKGLTGDLVSGYNLSAPATREMIAQMFYNTLMTPYVNYTAAGGYVNESGNPTPGSTIFIMSEVENTAQDENALDAYEEAQPDAFGSPAASKVMTINGKVVAKKSSETLIASYTGKQAPGAVAAELAKLGVTEYAADAKSIQNGADVTGTSNAMKAAAASKKTVATAKLDDGVRNIMDVLTSSDNSVVKVYVDQYNKITRVLSINTFVQVLAKADITSDGLKLRDAWGWGSYVNNSPAEANYEPTEGQSFAVGDVVLFTRGYAEGVEIVTAEKAKSFEGKLDKITSKTSGTTYNITDKDGTNKDYTKSDAVASLNTSGLAGKECTFYYIEDHGTKYLVHVVAKDGTTGSDTETPAAATHYILILGNAQAKEVEGDWTKDEDAYWTAVASGVKDDGTFSNSYTVRDAEGKTFVSGALIDGGEDAEDYYRGVAQNALKEKVYSYTENDNGELVLSAAVAVAVKPGINVGQVSVSANIDGVEGNETVTLNGSTEFVFFEKTDKDSVTVKEGVAAYTGNKNIGENIKNDVNTWIVAEAGVAKVVFVNKAYKETADSTSNMGTLVYVTGDTTTVEEANNKTTTLYEIYTTDGEQDYVEKVSTLTIASGADGAGIYTLDSDGKIKEKVAQGTSAAINQKRQASGIVTALTENDITVGSTKLNLADTIVAKGGATVTADELEIGQTVYYITGDTTYTENDVYAVWITADAESADLTVDANWSEDYAEKKVTGEGDLSATGSISSVTLGEGVVNTVTITITKGIANKWYTVSKADSASDKVTIVSAYGDVTGLVKADANGNIKVVVMITGLAAADVTNDTLNVELAVSGEVDAEVEMPTVDGVIMLGSSGKLKKVKTIAQTADVTVSKLDQIVLDETEGVTISIKAAVKYGGADGSLTSDSKSAVQTGVLYAIAPEKFGDGFVSGYDTVTGHTTLLVKFADSTGTAVRVIIKKDGTEVAHEHLTDASNVWMFCPNCLGPATITENHKADEENGTFAHEGEGHRSLGAGYYTFEIFAETDKTIAEGTTATMTGGFTVK